MWNDFGLDGAAIALMLCAASPDPDEREQALSVRELQAADPAVRARAVSRALRVPPQSRTRELRAALSAEFWTEVGRDGERRAAGLEATDAQARYYADLIRAVTWSEGVSVKPPPPTDSTPEQS